MPQQIHHRRCDGDFIFFPAAVRWLRIRTQRGDPNSPSTHSTARAPPADPGSVSPSKEQHPEALALGPGADWVTAELGSTTRSIGYPRHPEICPCRSMAREGSSYTTAHSLPEPNCSQFEPVSRRFIILHTRSCPARARLPLHELLPAQARPPSQLCLAVRWEAKIVTME